MKAMKGVGVKRAVVLTVVLAAISASSLALAAPISVPRGVAATVARKSIPISVLDHWLFVAAKSDAAAKGSGGPVIVPTDPPTFARCIDQVRSKLPHLRHRSGRFLRAYCDGVFHRLSQLALDFLIQAHWYFDEASARGITITRQEVLRAFHRAKRQQFSTQAQFRNFLRQTGQTISDVLLRFRLSLAIKRLVGHAHGKDIGKVYSLLYAQVRGRYRPQTECARFYMVSDCGNQQPSRGFVG